MVAEVLPRKRLLLPGITSLKRTSCTLHQHLLLKSVVGKTHAYDLRLDVLTKPHADMNEGRLFRGG